MQTILFIWAASATGTAILFYRRLMLVRRMLSEACITQLRDGVESLREMVAEMNMPPVETQPAPQPPVESPEAWSKTPPTDGGYYWIRSERTGKESPYNCEGIVTPEGADFYFGMEFGQRIPSNAELWERSRQHSGPPLFDDLADIVTDTHSSHDERDAATDELLKRLGEIEPK